MSTQLSQIARKAQLDRKARFTSLAHLLTPAFLKETWGMMNRRAASGIDGESTKQFESRHLPCTTGPAGRNTQRAGQGRDAAARDTDGRGSTGATGGGAHPRSGLRGGLH